MDSMDEAWESTKDKILSEDLYATCEDDIAMALDHMSFKNKDDSFAAFNVDIQFFRDKDAECQYCSKKARWTLIYQGKA